MKHLPTLLASFFLIQGFVLPMPVNAGNDAVFTDSFEGVGVVISCSGPPPEPVAERCEVTPGTSFLLLKSHLATPDLLYQNGELLVDDAGAIQCAGCSCAGSPGYADATTLLCPDVVATPGLINSHDHVTFQSPPADHGAERFDHRHDWRTGNRGHSNVSVGSTGSASVRAYGEVRQLLGGATSLIGSGSAQGFLRNLDRPNDRDGLVGPAIDLDTFPFGDSRGDLLNSGCDYPNQPTPSAGAVYSAHIAEGIDVEARNEWLCAKDAVSAVQPGLPGPSLVHAIALTADDAPDLVAADATIVWSPRSDISLYGMTSPVSLFHDQGVNIALGTNWAATGSANMLREFSCASQHNQTAMNDYFSDQDLLQMATSAAARAAGLADQIGALEPGLLADITLFDARINTGFLAATRARTQDIVLVLKAGVPLFGDGPVVEGLGFGDEACELMGTVVPGDCLSNHRLCASREGANTGLTYASLNANSQGLEPLYSCNGPPAIERSCQPARNEGDGITYDGVANASDQDGDGVPNEADNCPDIFNPPRPVSGFLQADSDNDGLGDLCDSQP